MKRIAMSLFVVLCGLLIVVPAQATPVSLNDVVNVTAWGPGGGGVITYHNNSTGADFDTFCLESGVYIYPGSYYQVTNISNDVISGGSGLTSLANQTKWLFYQWAMGSLDGYAKYGEYSLQLAIWYFQNQLTEVADAGALYFISTAKDGSYLPVFAANPTLLDSSGKLTGQEGQSFLIVQTPEPMTLILLGAGLMGLAGLRRKE
jgi:hypothetical protein